MATVAHAVEGFPSIWVTSPTLSRVVAGKIIGLAHDRDLALIQLSTSLAGHVFSLEPDLPRVGTELEAMGFSQGKSLKATFGHITDTHIRAFSASATWHAELSGLLQTDAALNPGNSGGPWLTRAGTVVALTEGIPSDEGGSVQGSNIGVPTSDARPLLKQWKAKPAPPASNGCVDPYAKSAAGQGILTLDRYFYDIDQSDYASAFAQLDPANHPADGVAAFTNSVQSSIDTAQGMNTANFASKYVVNEANPELDVRFRSTQRAALGPDGQTCTDWSLRYHFKKVAGVWLVHSTTAIPGSTKFIACPKDEKTAPAHPSDTTTPSATASAPPLSAPESDPPAPTAAATAGR